MLEGIVVAALSLREFYASEIDDDKLVKELNVIYRGALPEHHKPSIAMGVLTAHHFAAIRAG